MSKGEDSRSSRVRVPFFILILVFWFFFFFFYRLFIKVFDHVVPVLSS